jgi:threonine/homoserine/homoserine lactone efflux protein
MALASAAGLAALVAAVPALAVAMRLAGSGYLLWLAWQIANSGAIREGVIGRPMGIVAGAAFQLVNPKAWIFALGAVTTFRPADLPAGPGTVAIALVMAAVIVPSAALWAAFGDGLGRLMERDRTRLVVNGLLALLVVLTIALVWI